MKLHFSDKTWYFLLLLAAALGMADGFAMLFSLDYSFLELFSFGGCGLAALFLAAQQAPGEPGEDGARLARHAARKPNPYSGFYFACFAALLVSYFLFGNRLAMRLTIFWPLLVLCEDKRGKPLRQQLRLLIFIEILQAAALLCMNGGLAGFGTLSIVFWILTCTARGWAALVLYQKKTE